MTKQNNKPEFLSILWYLDNQQASVRQLARAIKHDGILKHTVREDFDATEEEKQMHDAALERHEYESQLNAKPSLADSFNKLFPQIPTFARYGWQSFGSCNILSVNWLSHSEL